MQRVLGIDPGTHRVGWAIIEGSAAKQTMVACGCIESKPGTSQSTYLPLIQNSLQTIIETYHPNLLGIETLLFQKNISTAIPVAQARGVAILVASNNNLSVTELAPNTVKSVVAGSGSASKKELERMVGLLLRRNTSQLIDDTTDALAIAIAAIVTHRL